MTRLEYNSFRGWFLPEDEVGSDKGYLVEYLDGKSKANTTTYKGYVSWSPKEVFDNSYRELNLTSVLSATITCIVLLKDTIKNYINQNKI